MQQFSLANDGDSFERHYYGLFIRDEFPSYEAFWLDFIVPLTNRPVAIHFRTDQQLNAIGCGDHEIVVAQLHYSVVRHLARVYNVKSGPQLDLDLLTEGIIRLVGAQDVAFELLERFQNPGRYDPWLPVRRNRVDGSREARSAWQKNNQFPLQNIRNYRNHLAHGRLMPGVIDNLIYLPRIGHEEKYFDWRLITNNPGLNQLIGTDFIAANEILDDAWAQTLNYFEAQWQQYLV